MEKQSQKLLDDLKQLLLSREASTQDDICAALQKRGYDINQSKVSRLLRKVGAIKVTGEQGQTVYALLREPAPPAMAMRMRDLILDVVSNETMIIIFTSPGSASIIARILDYQQIKSDILGTLAGDDTIFVAPRSIKDTKRLCQEIKALLV